jgi:FkbM family methyltransferase
MKKSKKLKLELTRGWNFPLKERLTQLLIPARNVKDEPFFKGVSFTDFGMLIHIDTSNYIEYKVFAEGSYEKETRLLMLNFLAQGDTVLDVGANIGVHAIPLAQKIGTSGKLFAFEPVPFVQHKLKKNIELNQVKNIEIIPHALSNEEIEISTNFGADTNNFGTFSLADTDQGGQLKISTLIGDKFVDNNNINHIKLIKIDVEGFEYKVLSGLKNTILNQKPVLFFEFDSNYIHRADSSANDFNDLLFDVFKYKVFKINKSNLEVVTDFNSLNGMEELLGLYQ